MRTRLIYNPTSGQETMKKNIAEILDVLEGFGHETLLSQQQLMNILQKMKQDELQKLDLNSLLQQVVMVRLMKLLMELHHLKIGPNWRSFQQERPMILHVL